MNMITIQLEIPEEMKPYLISPNSDDRIRQYALILYPYILNKTISHGKAAKILGIPKLDLIDMYAQMGFPYYALTMDELDKDLETFRSLKEAPVNQPADKSSAILKTAPKKYMQKNSMTMGEIEQEIQDYRKEKASQNSKMFGF